MPGSKNTFSRAERSRACGRLSPVWLRIIFHTMDVENLRLHYNKTLLCWADNFHKHIEEERKMFDERFLRMWDMYLNACAATFHNGIIDIHQILLTKGINNDFPMVRWY